MIAQKLGKIAAVSPPRCARVCDFNVAGSIAVAGSSVQPHGKLTIPHDDSSIWCAQTAQDHLLSRKYTRNMIPGSSHFFAAATVYAVFLTTAPRAVRALNFALKSARAPHLGVHIIP